MFTGIVESLGSVERIEKIGLGDSISVNGVCLTVTRRTDRGFEADVVEETLLRTDLGALGGGDSVNLERPVRADGRFGGHVVQGHVDATGTVASMDVEGESVRMRVTLAPSVARYVAEKGSIAVDGVSLTVTVVGPDWFEVALIPHTLHVTVLGLRNPGDTVNIEVDVLAKYVERLLAGAR
jgi:riboflavin synthase